MEQNYYLYYPESGCIDRFADPADRQDEIESWSGRAVSYIPIDGTDQLVDFMKSRESQATTTRFEVGKTYEMRSICDYDCVWFYTILRRTPKTVTMTGISTTGTEQEQTCRIRIHDGIETIMPLGRYSMAPVLSADKVKPDRWKHERSFPEDTCDTPPADRSDSIIYL